VLYTQRAEKPDGWLLEILDEYGVDVHAATADGQLSILPLAEFYPPGGQTELVHRALLEGYRAVRLSAESDAALSFLSADRYRQLEEAMEEICRSLPVSAMCQYDTRTTVGHRFLDAVTSHPQSVITGQMYLRRHPDGVELHGELDLASNEALLLTLRHATDHSAAAGSLRVSLRGLSFIDVAGCRALLLGTEPFREAGGQLRLESAQAQVGRVLRVLGVDRQRGVTLEE